MKSDFRYCVIGLGGLGSAAAYWLSRQAGGDVLGLERFALGHGNGESHDHSRIIRLTYDTPAYVRYAQASYETWREIEAESGEELIVQCGDLDLWPPDTDLDESAYRTSMDACGVGYELWDAGETMRRFPQFRLPDDVHALFQRQGGLVAAMKATAAHQRLARQRGAVLLDNQPVRSITETGGEYVIETQDHTFRCEKLVIAAGPWTNRILSMLGTSLPLTVTIEQVTYYDSPDPAAFMPGRFPVWMWMIDANYYGFPTYGAAGPKASKDRFVPCDPDARSFEPDAGNAGVLDDFVGRYIPSMLGPHLHTKTCILTHTPDVDFVIDAAPGHPDCLVAVGAAHAYKFASVIGRTLSDLATTGQTRFDIAAFRFDREALRLGVPPFSV